MSLTLPWTVRGRDVAHNAASKWTVPSRGSDDGAAGSLRSKAEWGPPRQAIHAVDVGVAVREALDHADAGQRDPPCGRGCHQLLPVDRANGVIRETPWPRVLARGSHRRIRVERQVLGTRRIPRSCRHNDGVKVRAIAGVNTVAGQRVPPTNEFVVVIEVVNGAGVVSDGVQVANVLP